MGHTKRRGNPQLKARTTRSSRGRLLSLSDPAQNSQLLDDQLRQLGLYPAPTIGDGNCLFRALSDQRYGTDSKHAQLRQDICDWIQRNKARYEPFVEDERGIDTHLRCMRENATYGGHMELSAFAHMARRNVKVVQPGLVYVIEWQAFYSPTSPQAATAPQLPIFPDKEDDQPDDDDSTIYVAYHDWEHFSSIRNLKGPHVGLPRVQERSPPPADIGPGSPITEDYVPAKGRKKVEKEKERERRERKRERARNKSKFGGTPNSTPGYKGKQKATNEITDSDSEFDEDAMESVVLGTELPNRERQEVSPEKLKIKLKLTLNGISSNPSSANISESENTNTGNIPNNPKLIPHKTGLKLRLPPSRSLSVTPSNLSTVSLSNASTPPMSQVSVASSEELSEASTSSGATLPTGPTTTSMAQLSPPHTQAQTFSSSPPQVSSSSVPSHSNSYPRTSSSSSHSYPNSSSAPIPSSSYPSLIATASERTNRSPKRTFDESELEDRSSTSSHNAVRGEGGRNGRAQIRSRLRGPDEEDEEESMKMSTSMVFVPRDVEMNVAEGNLEREREGAEEREEWEVVETLVEQLPSSGTTSGTKENVQEEGYDSDAPSSLSSLDTSSSEAEPEPEPEAVGTPATSGSSISPPPSQEVTLAPASPMLVSPSKPVSSSSFPPSSPSPSPSKSKSRSQSQSQAEEATLTRRQKQIKRELESGLNGIAYANQPIPFSPTSTGGGGGGKEQVLTRRQRKLMGLPKARRGAGVPYDRSSATSATGGGSGSGGKGGKKGGSGKDGKEEEWRRNGTGRVDVRGFRELKI